MLAARAPPDVQERYPCGSLAALGARQVPWAILTDVSADLLFQHQIQSPAAVIVAETGDVARLMNASWLWWGSRRYRESQCAGAVTSRRFVDLFVPFTRSARAGSERVSQSILVELVLLDTSVEHAPGDVVAVGILSRYIRITHVVASL